MTQRQSERSAEKQRATTETRIEVTLDLDGSGAASIDTGIGFFDHMLMLLAKHSGIDLKIAAKGDLDVDPHHTVEDVGLVLGDALNEALGDKSGIERFGFAYVPMDEALVRAVIDLSGRPYCHSFVSVRSKRLGNFDTELVDDFMAALSSRAGMSLHLDVIRGRNSHHVVEAAFKATARALGQAVSKGRAGVPSTKGTLSS